MPPERHSLQHLLGTVSDALCSSVFNVGFNEVLKQVQHAADGNKVIAWFTEEVPLAVGPLDLSGLPGLILEYFNPKSKRLFKATTISSIQIPEQKFRKWLTGLIVSRNEYREIYENDSKKLQQMMRMTDGRASESER